MLKLGDLALKQDLKLGPVHISPSRRLIEGPGGRVQVEPLVMQVLLLLVDAAGKVVSRTELFDECWGNSAVGDDSLNRTILKLRNAGRTVAPGLFEIETIPRTGYRLTGEILEHLKEESPAPPPQETLKAPVSRRALIGGGAATAATLAGGLWWGQRDLTENRVGAVIDRGRQALRLGEPDARKHFEQAVEIEPRDARAWGLLAYSIGSSVGDGPVDMDGLTAAAVERAVQTALNINRNEPNALLAMTVLQWNVMDWYAREEAYRRILAIDISNTLTMKDLGQLLHSVGRCREALRIAEQALAIEPLWPDLQLRKALRLWVIGRTAEADQVIGRAIELWPTHRLVRLGRLMIYAFTGRTRAAMALVEEEEAKPILMSAEVASVWRSSLVALETRTAPAIAAARDASLKGAKAVPATASWAILLLSALGELDAAFEIAEGFLLGRGSIIVRPRPEKGSPPVHTPGWRNTFGLFTPPTKAMRLDARFHHLADGLGLTDYWRKRRIGPDDFLFATAQASPAATGQ